MNLTEIFFILTCRNHNCISRCSAVTDEKCITPCHCRNIVINNYPWNQAVSRHKHIYKYRRTCMFKHQLCFDFLSDLRWPTTDIQSQPRQV